MEKRFPKQATSAALKHEANHFGLKKKWLRVTGKNSQTAVWPECDSERRLHALCCTRGGTAAYDTSYDHYHSLVYDTDRSTITALAEGSGCDQGDRRFALFWLPVA